MGTVPTGTGELRSTHSRVSWMFLPVLRSITVSAPQIVDLRRWQVPLSVQALSECQFQPRVSVRVSVSAGSVKGQR